MESIKTILIVDDDPHVRIVLDGMLYGQNFNLVHASNGMEALAKATETIPDLILLDVVMPDMDGFEVCQRLRADPILAEVPVLMLTGLDNRDARLQGIKAGADDFIAKPFDSIELQARIQTIVRLNRYRRLLNERARFEWVVEHAEDGYLIINSNMQILYANSQARFYLALLAKPTKEITETFFDLVAKQYLCNPKEAWATWPMEINPQIPRYLVRPETATAHTFWLQVDLIEMANNLTEEYLVRLHNITNTILSRRIVWAFHEQISHKLKTPLNYLTLSLDYLAAEHCKMSDAKRGQFINTARDGVSRLESEITDIFQFMEAVNSSQPGQTECSVTKILAIIEETSTTLEIGSVSILYTPPSYSPVYLDKDDDSNNDVYVVMSERAMQLILTEILENAKKFHPEQSPKLEIKIAVVSWQNHLAKDKSEGLRLCICDDGVNLSPEQLAQIWIPYYQGDKYFTGEVGGMGLGLSMVASLIWSVGGTCQAYNCSQGAGIIIELTVPLSIV